MSSPSKNHRPRKKRKSIQSLTRSATITDIVKIDSQDNIVTPEFPLVAFLWPARGTTSQWVLLPLILMIVGLFRWCVGLWGHSGYQRPPMHGDLEAQRHWMEITAHLPVSKWYFYDLPYWGLDYPPLTAYHSWLCGKIGSFLNPTWFALDESRGLETQDLKLFLRATVIVSEYLIYIPALIILLRHFSRSQGTGTTASSIALVAILMQPATILIDHGHFQYNTVMLGFVVATLSSIFAGRLLWSCIFFVAALGFKQMALYYSPVIFAFLLGSCFSPSLRLGRLVSIGLITLLAFAVLLAPLLLGSLYDSYRKITPPGSLPPAPFLAEHRVSLNPDNPFDMVLLQLSQVVHRMFPFARGVFEDKVANFWCFANTFYKLRNLQKHIELPRLSAIATLLSIFPPMLVIGAVPKKTLLPYALATSAWGFFLFSFQVHEKSVLLPLLPMTLLLGTRQGLSKEYRAWVGWANILGVWTMYPLLKRDGLTVPYVVITFLWCYLLGLPPTSVGAYHDPELENVPGRPLAPDELRTPTKILHFQTYIIMAFWHLLAAFASPPEDKPDLWIVANACVGAVAFGICYLWCLWKLVSESGLLDGYFGNEDADEHSPPGKDRSATPEKKTK
ncbi:alpha-1,3-glucosyltransferase [Exophiala viscosa]|uniref:Alpha-1,3-glucosyltransferase n=1 Tax=Exophiala viscosa TaxID=2486360 RepID=A0AAN6DVF0_9EURO|nr:alpha-1,3-glucosyltransferase [Exophiala viscosa]